MGAKSEARGKTEGDKHNKNHASIYDQVSEMLKVQIRSELLGSYF